MRNSELEMLAAGEVVALTFVSEMGQGREHSELVASWFRGGLARGKIVLDVRRGARRGPMDKRPKGLNQRTEHKNNWALQRPTILP